MNTSAAAKALGVSLSTVQRWAAASGLNIERNQHGHYVFSDADIEAMKQIQTEQNSGPPAQQPKRKGRRTQPAAGEQDEYGEAIRTLQRQLENKADSVVSYQLLQHRQEIEELQGTISKLEKRLSALENREQETITGSLQPGKTPLFQAGRKKRIFQMLFGF